MGKRNEYLDFCKGIAIILVIVGHCIEFGSGKEFSDSQLHLYNKIFIFIYSFHMPFFILFSGYLFHHSINKHSTEGLLKSRIETLLIPIVVWNIIYCLIQCRGMSAMEFIQYYLNSCLTNAWFLWAVFINSIIILIINKLYNDNILIYSVIYILTYFITDDYNLHLYKYLYPFFLIGYLTNKNMDKIMEKVKKRRFIMVYLFIFSAMGYILLLQFWNYNSYIYTSQYAIWNKPIFLQITINIYRTFVGFFGSAAMIILLKIIFTYLKGALYWIKNFIIRIGKFSLGIYMSQAVFLSFMATLTRNNHYNRYISFLETFIILILSYVATYIISSNKITNKLFLGGRKQST